MNVDPVVQEVRRNGEKIAEECDGDVHRMAELLRRRQADHAHRVVSRAAQHDRRGDNTR